MTLVISWLNQLRKPKYIPKRILMMVTSNKHICKTDILPCLSAIFITATGIFLHLICISVSVL